MTKGKNIFNSFYFLVF